MRTPDEEFVEGQRFYQFILECIVPTQKDIWKEWSDFHKELVFTCCLHRAVVAAPRGSTKSWICSRFRPLYQLVTSPPAEGGKRVDILLLSETSTLAIENMDWIKDQIRTNPYIHARYGNFYDKSLTWNEDEARLSNGHRVVAIGYGGQVRGRHPTSIYVDDLESLENMGNQEKLVKLKAWFNKVLMGTLDDDTKTCMVVGTVLSKQSLLQTLLDNPAWRGRKFKAIMLDEEAREYSMWPQRWPLTWLRNKRKEIGVHAFNSEYQNEPLGMDDPILLPEWIRRYDPMRPYPTPHVRTYIMVDPAFTEERHGDYSAIIVADETEDGKVWIRTQWRRKVNMPTLRDTIVAFYRAEEGKRVPVELGIEEVAAQKGLRQIISEANSDIPIVPMRPDADKARRLISVSRYFELGMVCVPQGDEVYAQELLNFPFGDKDRVDATVYVLKRYEQLHPVLTPYVPVDDPSKPLDDVSQIWYGEQALLGTMGYERNSPVAQRAFQAQTMWDMIGDEGWD